MKKITVLMIAWMMACFDGSLVRADCARIDEGLGVTIPCIEYNGQRYEVSLDYNVGASDPAGMYWTIRAVAGATRSGECATITNDLDLILPCVEYQGLQYSLSLHYSNTANNQTGHFWRPGTFFSVARSVRARNAAPVVSASDLMELVSGNSAFSLGLYQAIRQGNDNLFYSPYSISMALAMTYAGARAETAQQMANALRFTLPQDRLHRAFNSLDLALASRGEGVELRGGERFRLNVANSLWGQAGYPFLSEFLDVLAENYGARLAVMDFTSAPEDSRVIINSWVSELTEGKIQNLIPQGGITTLTRLVLTNAIYFTASWKYPFNASRTQDGAFNLLNGGQATAPMMSQTEQFSYAEGENYQAVELPYIGDALSMVIVIPRSGRFEDFEQSLTLSGLNAIVANLAQRNMQLTVPKFTYASAAISLRQTLAQMGMPVAFTDTADFSGMVSIERVFISDVLHKAFIAVDEAGTEAAAATAVIIAGTSMPQQPVELIINRPFIFFIRDMQTGAILFMGRIMNPAG